MPTNKIALLSRGPSLNDSWTRPLIPLNQYDEIVGVNDVVEEFLCSWWCFRDVSTFVYTGQKQPILGTPKVFIGRQVPDKLSIKHPGHDKRLDGYAKEFHESHDFPALPPFCEPWYRWSGTAALGLCHRLLQQSFLARLLDMDKQAAEVHCYGVDLAGLDDFRKRETAARSGDRWVQEGILWENMVKAMSLIGIKVIRAGQQ